DNKLAQKDTYAPDSAKANMVVHPGSSSRSNSKGKCKDKRKNDKKGKGKSEYLAPKAGIVKRKFQGTYYNCDQPGHRAANCKMPKRVNPRQDALFLSHSCVLILYIYNMSADCFKTVLILYNKQCSYSMSADAPPSMYMRWMS
ncbi:callose synthase 2-like protein, partial [Tanacetum coccineum]